MFERLSGFLGFLLTFGKLINPAEFRDFIDIGRNVIAITVSRLGPDCVRIIWHHLDCGVKLPAGSTCADPTPVLRSYTSFSQAATENALSRIFIGFHFRKSIEEGETGELYAAIREGQHFGMNTMNQALEKLYQEKKISYEEAIQSLHGIVSPLL